MCSPIQRQALAKLRAEILGERAEIKKELEAAKALKKAAEIEVRFGRQGEFLRMPWTSHKLSVTPNRWRRQGKCGVGSST